MQLMAANILYIIQDEFIPVLPIDEEKFLMLFVHLRVHVSNGGFCLGAILRGIENGVYQL